MATTMLQLIQSNLNICPKTKINILWENVTNGIKISNEDFNYLAKIKDIKKLEYIENGCYLINEYDNKYWYKFGKRHREDGPAFECSNGDKVYFINGKRHREDGPAFEYSDGTKSYYINGKRHREDGPAFELPNGTKAYYLDGNNFSEKEYWEKVKKLNAAINSK